jgi:hypothetical protein
MKIVKLFIVMMSLVTAWDIYDCYVNFTPANVIWLLVASHALMFYVMLFTVEFITRKRR